MKIAVFANMNAGGGRAAAAVTKIAKAWSSHELFGVSGFGGEKLPRSIIPEAAEGYVPRLNAAIRRSLGQSRNCSLRWAATAQRPMRPNA